MSKADLPKLQTAGRVARWLHVPVRWLSVEPLSFDLAPLLQNCGLQWAVIGAATNCRKTHQPRQAWVQAVLDTLDAQDIPVFFKGNLDWSPWRAEWPRTSSSLVSGEEA